jgi:acyl carrier protein
MGFDLLDILFRLEKSFGIRIPKGELEKFARRNDPPDLRVQDLVDMVRSKWPQPAVRDGVIADDRRCTVCDYNLRGLPNGHRCPECGASASYEGQIYDGVSRVLVDSLGVDEKEIDPGASVPRDLGGW